MRFKLDENLPRRLVEVLTTDGHDALTAAEQRLGGAPDEKLTAACQAENRALIKMFMLARAVTYATLFVGLVLIFLPARILTASGVVWPAVIGVWQVAGVLVGIGGAALALWCILTFVFVGRGTPAPFDPPRRLVVQGPYRLVRNPMYIGAGIAVLGAALFYQSFALLSYVGVFFLVTHLFVIGYEEPTLRRIFSQEYKVYCRNVGRWWPVG